MRESENPKFDFKSTVRDMLLKDILSTQFPGAEKHIEGRLDTDIALTGSGGDWDTIQKVLRGQGRIEIMDGALKDVNIVEGALSGVTGIRGLSGLISHRVSEKYPELFGADDTRFDVLSGTVQISGGLARTNDLTISARDYTIIGKGIFAFENLLDFTATLSASQKLTDDLVSDVKGAEYITDEQGRLSIPFRMAGALPEVKPKPDTKFIAKALKRGLVKGGIEKLFGGKKKSGEESEEQKKPSFKEIIKDLEGIFGR